MKLQEIEKIFRINLEIGKGVSDEAVRQFVRVVENIYEGKRIYKVTSIDEIVTYHATMGDIARHLITKGILGASVQNIQSAASLGSRAYGYLIEYVNVEKEIIK